MGRLFGCEYEKIRRRMHHLIGALTLVWTLELQSKLSSLLDGALGIELCLNMSQSVHSCLTTDWDKPQRRHHR